MSHIRFLSAMMLMGLSAAAAAPPESSLDVGVGVRDVTPEGPVWLAGYEARKRPSERVDQRLVAQAIAFRNPTGERWVVVALDNCEVSREFIAPTIQEIRSRHKLAPGAVMIVCSHSHSTPVLEGPLLWIYGIPDEHLAAVKKYGDSLKVKLAEAIDAALADLQPAALDHAIGRATFAMNRRQFIGGRVILGEDPDGPVDWDVPVLRVRNSNGDVRAIVFGYACHATTVAGKASTPAGDDWYTASPDFVGYARQHLEAAYPGATAIFLTGMGADSNPSPRGNLLASKRHGLELAGAVTGVLSRPMRPVPGPFRMAFEEIELPLVDPPGREQIERDAGSENQNIRFRARTYLKLLAESKPLPRSVKMSLAAIRFGDDLTLIAMGGEPVVDYTRRFKRLFAGDNPWTVGYAYDVPCYIPTARIIAEGGYEADSSLTYAALYGPFRHQIEEAIVNKATELVTRVRR